MNHIAKMANKLVVYYGKNRIRTYENIRRQIYNLLPLTTQPFSLKSIFYLELF